MNNKMIKFGKYKGKLINQINDHDYIKFLSNYDYEVCDDECQYKVCIFDRHMERLDSILLNKDAYINYWKCIDESKNDVWNELEFITNSIEKIRFIYNNREYFDYENTKWMNNRSGKFATFYLILYHLDIIQEVRNYLKNNKICLHCGIKMPVIGSNRTNGADHDDWETRMFHKKCFKEIINDL
jgi:hypothetical protein